MRFARKVLNGLAVAAAVVLLAVVLAPLVGQAQVSVLNYFAQTGGNDNVLNLDGTLEFEDKATVLDHGTATLNANGYASVTTNLSSTVTCTLGLVSISPADDPVMVTGLWTSGGATLEVFAWKNISGTDPTLAASSTASVKVGYICAGAD